MHSVFFLCSLDSFCKVQTSLMDGRGVTVVIRAGVAL